MCYDFFGRQLLLFTCLEGKSFYSHVQHQVQQATGASGAASHRGIRGLPHHAEEANHCLRSLQRNWLLKGLVKAGLFYLAVAQHQYMHQNLQAWAS